MDITPQKVQELKDKINRNSTVWKSSAKTQNKNSTEERQTVPDRPEGQYQRNQHANIHVSDIQKKKRVKISKKKKIPRHISQ